jgi:NADH-quinone oxidoreductase subunit F
MMNAAILKSADTHPLTWRLDHLGSAPLDLKTYELLEGFAGLRKAITEMNPQSVQVLVKDANLRGRGGPDSLQGQLVMVRWEKRRQRKNT